MSIRLLVTITAAPGKGAELAQAYWYLTHCLFLPQCSSFMLCLVQPH